MSDRLCKHCKKPLKIALSGLREFCSPECKKAHRRAYMADLMKAKRSVSKSGGYIDINSSNVSKSKPYQKPICEGQNGGHGLSEDNFQGFGGKKWHDLAKRACSNFEMRQQKGYCITLTEPYHVFRLPCCECALGQALMVKA